MSAREHRLSPALALLVACSGAFAGTVETRIDCPVEINASTVKVSKPPPGWRATVREPILLHAIDVTMGPPEQLVILKPKDASKGSVGVDLWTGLKQRPPGTGGVWLACNYGDSDTIVLGKRLNDNVSECRATYSKDEQGGFRVDFRCK